MNEEDIKSNVKLAIDEIVRNDSFLFKNDVAERTITAKLACYLQNRFEDWDVDCEYNRNGIDPKRLKDVCNSTVNGDGSLVYPDVIIHKRNINNNLVVIEVKKTTNIESDECDLTKLRAFKSELNYKYCLFIRFKVGTEIGIEKLEWI